MCARQNDVCADAVRAGLPAANREAVGAGPLGAFTPAADGRQVAGRQVEGDVTAFAGLEVQTGKARQAVLQLLCIGRRRQVQLRDFVTGDMGESYINHLPVSSVIGPKLVASVELALASVALAALIAVPGGILSAMKHRTRVDSILTGFITNELVLFLQGLYDGLGRGVLGGLEGWLWLASAAMAAGAIAIGTNGGTETWRNQRREQDQRSISS